MTASTRMDRLFSVLTARERGLLVLRAWKDGGGEGRQVRSTTPNSQVAEFSRGSFFRELPKKSIGFVGPLRISRPGRPGRRRSRSSVGVACVPALPGTEKPQPFQPSLIQQAVAARAYRLDRAPPDSAALYR